MPQGGFFISKAFSDSSLLNFDKLEYVGLFLVLTTLLRVCYTGVIKLDKTVII